MSSALGPYRALASSRLRTLLQYRAAALAGAATQVFFGFVRFGILAGFYRSAAGPVPFDFAHVGSYVWLGQGFFAMQPWRLDSELVGEFRSGRVAYQLLRPVDLYGFWWARYAAMLLAPTLLRVGPVLAIGAVFSSLGPPDGPGAFLAFSSALAGAWVLGAAMLTTVSATLFWTVAGEGVAALHTALFFLLSGMVVPLPLFPDWARPVLEVLPYGVLVDAPFRLYTGHLPPTEAGRILALQLGWTLLLALGGRRLLARGLRHAVVQGG